MKLINWLKSSNRWKHLVGGIIIGAISNSIWCAGLSGIGIASALEYKDRCWGGQWDWVDWSITLVGVAVGYITRIGVLCLI